MLCCVVFPCAEQFKARGRARRAGEAMTFLVTKFLERQLLLPQAPIVKG